MVTADTAGRPPSGDIASELRLPRAQTGPASQHLLVTVLGDLWYDGHEAIPASVLLALLAEFHVSESASRSAINRLVRRGLLERLQDGRVARYLLTGHAFDILHQGLRDIAALTSAPRAWDGAWTCAAFSVSESQRDVRSTLRTRLRWLGFAPLFDAFWVSPHGAPEEVSRVLTELGVSSATVLRGAADVGSPLNPISAWDLDALRDEYHGFHLRHEPQLRRLRAGLVGAAEALVERTRLMDEWRRFLLIDPALPDEVLPRDWPRTRARRTFLDLYDGLGQLALIRARQVIAQYDQELADRVRLHSIPEDIESAAG